MTEKLLTQITDFRDDLDWKQFHNGKDLAVALNIEASELLEAFLWKESEAADPENLSPLNKVHFVDFI